MKALTHHVLRDHVLIGGMASLMAFPFLGPWGSLAFWLSTILVDLDHYLDFLLRTRFRMPGVGPMFRYHEILFQKKDRPEFLALEIFHTAEFLLLFGLFAFWRGGIFLSIFAGVMFHMLVDLIHLGRYRILTKRAHSLIEYLWRKKRFEEQGKIPAVIFKEVLEALGPQFDKPEFRTS